MNTTTCEKPADRLMPMIHMCHLKTVHPAGSLILKIGCFLNARDILFYAKPALRKLDEKGTHSLAYQLFE
jgi:hypothetical protein